MESTRAVGRLHPTDFTLHGFDHLLAALEQTLQSVVIRGDELQAPTVADAIFIPAMQTGAHFVEGALLTGDGQPIPQARAERRGFGPGDLTLGSLSQPVPLAPEQVIDEDVVYLGWYFGHFGHFLLESLARTWILSDLDPATKVVFHRERPVAPTGITRQMLDLLGIPPERILLPETQTRLRRVIVPEPLYEISVAAHERMPEPYRRITAAVGARDAPAAQPVYFSRRLLPSRQRPIIGEFELEEVCRENGFLVVHPEMMTLVDQIRLVNRHQDIFTSAGSAAYLSLFALGAPRLHVLTANIPFVDYFLIPNVAKLEATFVNCLAGDDRRDGHLMAQLVDMTVVADYLESVGLLTRWVRTSLAIQSAALQPAYDEAWFYKWLWLTMDTATSDLALEATATRLAQSSWPLSWALARYCLVHDPGRIDHLIRQFVDLAANETGIDRLAHYRKDIAQTAKQLLQHCSPATAARLIDILYERFDIGPAPTSAPGAKRRRLRPRKLVAPTAQEQAIIEEPATLTHETGANIWSSDAWRARAVSWLDQQLAAAGIERTGEPDSWHLQPWATVLRAPTTNGPVWFKATGATTSVEVGLYQLLPRIAPNHVLTPIAVDVSRGWIVLPDGGPPLGSVLAGTELVEALVVIFPDYGQLQRDLVPHMDRLLALGVPDRRPAIMPDRFAHALAAVRRYVERRGSGEERAAYERLAGLDETFAAWCDQLGAIPIPSSLDHGDLHPGNILVPDARRVTAKVFDWGLSAVAHPFTSLLITLRLMQIHLQVRQDSPEIRRLRDAYLEVFTDLAPRAELIAALELACQVGKVARAQSWLSLAGDVGSGTGGRRKQVMRWLSFLLDDAYLGRTTGL